MNEPITGGQGAGVRGGSEKIKLFFLHGFIIFLKADRFLRMIKIQNKIQLSRNILEREEIYT